MSDKFIFDGKEVTLPVSDFITTYVVAENIVTSAVNSCVEHWSVIKACQNHIAGEKPVNPKDLKDKGLGWVWNFNFYKARAKIENGVNDNCARTSASIALGYVTFRDYDEKKDKGTVLEFLDNPEVRGIVAAHTGYCLSACLSRETRLSGWLNDIEYPAYAFGFAALQFDRLDWMPKPIHPLNIAFAPNSRPYEIECWVTFGILKANELYRRWIRAKSLSQERERAEETGEVKTIASSGWILEGLEKLMLRAYRGKLDGNRSPDSWKDIVPLYINDSSTVISDTDDVYIAKIFYKELNGTITEVYIPYQTNYQSERKGDVRATTNNITSVNSLIFKKNLGKYDQGDYIQLIRDSGFSETGFIQDYRGIAKYAVEDSIRYNRLRNGIGNKMIFVGSPMFESLSGQSSDKFKLTVHQGFIVMPPSHTLIEKQPTFDIGSHINLLNFEESQYRRDTQQYDPSIQGRLTSRPNKGEVQQVTREVQETQNAKLNIKLRDYSSVFRTVLRRMPSMKAEKSDPGYAGKERFYSLMKKNLKSVIESDEDIDKILGAIDSYVIEPVIANVASIQMAIQMAETPFARNRLKRMLLIAQGLPIEEVNMTVPLTADKFTNLQDSRIATFENDMFFTTNEIVISGTDDHIAHLDIHLAKAKRVIEAFQQQRLAPREAGIYLENNLGHSMYHVDMLGEDPTLNRRAQEYFDAINEMMKVKDQIIQVAQKDAQAQAEAAAQPQLDPETANKIASDNAEVMADIARKDRVADSRTEQANRQIEIKREVKLLEKQIDAETRR